MNNSLLSLVYELSNKFTEFVENPTNNTRVNVFLGIERIYAKLGKNWQESMNNNISCITWIDLLVRVTPEKDLLFEEAKLLKRMLVFLWKEDYDNFVSILVAYDCLFRHFVYLFRNQGKLESEV